MRSISISTDVFAAIWSRRVEGEDTEDAILRRVLRAVVSQDAVEPVKVDGYFDPRYGVKLPAGFELYRSYLGTLFRARVISGKWVLEDGRSASSLNELSRLIGAKTENAWTNWFWTDSKGRRRKASDLRDPDTIITRKGEEDERITSVREDNAVTWRDDVLQALKNSGGKSSLEVIYKEVRRIRSSAGRTLPQSLDAVVRKTLEENSSDSEAFRHGPDLFRMSEGRGAGVWALR